MLGHAARKIIEIYAVGDLELAMRSSRRSGVTNFEIVQF